MTDEIPRLIPEVTDEIIEAHKENQKKWAKKVVVPDFLQDSEICRNFTELETLKDLYDRLNATADSPEHQYFIKEQIAKIYFMNGNFEVAFNFAQSEFTKATCLEYAEAVKLPENADCPHYKGEFINSVKRENIFIEKWFHIGGKQYASLRCVKCRFLNIKILSREETERFNAPNVVERV